MLSAFKYKGNHHQRGYYTAFRCQKIKNPNSDAAKKAAATFLAKGSGYDFLKKNCLTRAVDVLKNYGAQLPDPFTLGISRAPQDYFTNKLDKEGWPAAKNL